MESRKNGIDETPSLLKHVSYVGICEKLEGDLHASQFLTFLW